MRIWFGVNVFFFNGIEMASAIIQGGDILFLVTRQSK